MEKAKPVRIQRERTKGWNMQKASLNGLPVVYVGRPTKWGNPFKEGDLHPYLPEKMTADTAVYFYKEHLSEKEVELAKKELKGKNLCCWCSLDQPCHADVLLKIANSP